MAEIRVPRAKLETYLSWALGSNARVQRAEPLTHSTRNAPWRLDVIINDTPASYVLRLGARNAEHEYNALQGMSWCPVPTPRAHGWDPEGARLGQPAYLHDYVEGESLLGPMLAGEPWAEDLFLDTVCALQSITREQLATAGYQPGPGETALNFLEQAHTYFEANPNPLAEQTYARLADTTPPLPETRFSNGDLWLDNLIVRDQMLAAVIDFEHAGFSDPIYEFLLPFFVEPRLRGRGIEERYCRRMGFDPDLLPWYHGLEYYDIWHWVHKTGEPFVHYTATVLQEAIAGWLDG